MKDDAIRKVVWHHVYGLGIVTAEGILECLVIFREGTMRIHPSSLLSEAEARRVGFIEE